MDDALVQGAGTYHIATDDTILPIQVESYKVLLGLMSQKAEGIEDLGCRGVACIGLEVVGDDVVDGDGLVDGLDSLELNGRWPRGNGFWAKQGVDGHSGSSIGFNV